MQIKMLNSATINQIAAGEVVVRPASVVKELVENAIDAGATRVSVDIEEGGRKQISINDNGCGIPFNEIPLAFKRHATSKITTIDDLDEVGTLGFRGEALSSIVAVAKVNIKTRFKDEEIGSETFLTDGKIQSSRSCSRNIGTTITVSDLFYNVPARLKHMGKSETEAAHIAEIMERLSLSHPEIAFSYTQNQKTRFTTMGDGRLQGVIENIFGTKFFNDLIPIDYENAPMRITGYIGGLNAMKRSKDYQIFFMNDRYIKNTVLTKSFEEAYEGYVMQHCHPVCILKIDLPQKMLDVNIHPAKTEIGILNQSLFSLLFKQGIRSTLRDSDLSIKMVFRNDPVNEDVALDHKVEVTNDLQTEQCEQILLTEEDDFEPFFNQDDIRQKEMAFEQSIPIDYSQSAINKNDVADHVAESTVDYKMPILPKSEKRSVSFKNAKIIGQLFNTYILLEQGNEAILIDQHAAHEAFMYHELKGRFEQKTGFPSQLLMTPQRVEVESQMTARFDEFKEKCAFYGYDCTVQDAHTLLVQSVPVILGQALEADTIVDYLEIFLHDIDGEEKSLELKKIITMSCKAAVKGNQVLDHREIRKLLDQLEKIDNPYTCPHGRPIIFHLKKYELEKMFKRVI